MTKEEILKMYSGRELDILIAKVMGYSVYHYDKDHPDNCYYMLVDEHFDQVAPYEGWRSGERKTEELAWEDCPEFSSDVSLAMELVEHLRRKGFGFSLRMDNIIWAELYGLGLGYFTCVGYTVPEAICKATLLASLTKDIWYENK
jgi:hypothetical protein